MPDPNPPFRVSKFAEDQMKIYGLRLQDLRECYLEGSSMPGKRGQWFTKTVRGKSLALLVVPDDRLLGGVLVLDVRDRPLT